MSTDESDGTTITEREAVMRPSSPWFMGGEIRKDSADAKFRGSREP